jgi:adenine-specific DNA-methyltransferase
MPKQSVPKTTPSLTDEQLEALQTLIPQAFTEGRIDPEKLLASIGDIADDRPERYSFSWAGKRDAIRLLQVSSRATLIPARDESLDFDATQNIFIEGDNLEVLKLLYKPYFGRVKMIYIDPPYNTGNDFVYPDNFADPLDTYLQLTGQKDRAGNLLTSNPETGGRYHSAWLSMMYPRLFLARQLLSEDGVVFVSIDEHEISNIRLAMNEIFGEENFVESFIWKKSYGGGAKEKYAVRQHEYVLMYTRSLESLGEMWLPPDEESEKKYYKYTDKRGPYRIKPLEATRSMDSRPNLVFPIPTPWGGKVLPKRQWWWSYERVLKALEKDELVFIRNGDDASVSYKQYLFDENGDKRGSKPFSIIDGFYTQTGTQDLKELFDDELVIQFPKPVGLIKRLVSIGTNAGESDIVLDFFAGSCTTSQAVLELNREDGGNRRFIMVQLPEPTGNKQFPIISEIGKERIRRVVARMKKARAGQLALDKPEDLGFKVFKLAASNYRQWDAAQPDAAAFTRQAELFADPLVAGWQPENILYEIALKEGYGLNVIVEPVGADGVRPDTIFRVTDPDKNQSFYLTLAARVALEELRTLDLKKDNLFICRDTALDDEAAANLALQCRLKTI